MKNILGNCKKSKLMTIAEFAIGAKKKNLIYAAPTKDFHAFKQ